MQKLSFEVDSINIKEEIENSQFVCARARIFASGDNAHGLPVLESALYKAETTIYQKPLVWKYDKLLDDAMGHEIDEIPCGFVPSQGANISYEREDDGRLFFCVDILIWRFYSGKILEIFNKTDDEKSVSVEIAILELSKDEDEKESISEYSYLAITILGERFTPAVEGANIVLQFSVDKNIVENILQQSFSNNIQTKEVEDVVFNKDEFATTFSMTANELWEFLSNACNEVKYQEDGDDYQYCRFWMRDHDATYIYAMDYQENKLCAIPYSITDGTVSLDLDNMKSAKLAYIVTDEEPEDMMSFAEKIMSKKMEAFSKLESELYEAKENFSTLENEKNEIATKFSEQETEFENLKTENIKLQEFKSQIEEQEVKSKIDFAISAVSDDLNQEQVDEWRGKFTEFSSVEEFSNALKAFAYETTKGKKKDGVDIITMSLPDNQPNNEETKSVWQRI